ncbi:hypothetical protein [Dictyobacter kobayashii]|uniref:hypothetical protein n=1 Tax=Dictyobacter kobayashii TaxID=2014872 RepID=UPI000F840939|nr:hypothetical protein [Dictyobacter kobayashii]
MKPLEYPCRYCKRLTATECPECNVTCCLACGTNLCPICVRIKLVYIERALAERVVPWQYVDVLMLPLRRSFLLQTESVPAERSYQATHC